MSTQSRVTSRCDVAHSGRENLHHFLQVLLRGMLPLFSIMTLCLPRLRRATVLPEAPPGAGLRLRQDPIRGTMGREPYPRWVGRHVSSESFYL